MGVVNSYQELKRMDHEPIYRSSPNEAFSCRLCDVFPGLFQKEDDAWDVQYHGSSAEAKCVSERAVDDDREIKTNRQTAPFDRDSMES